MSEQQNTQQPAWWHARINGAHDALFNELPPDDAYDEGTLTALYAAPPVPRDVLMAFGEAVKVACVKAWGAADECDEGNAIRDCDIAAIADRYASQVQPEPVNQQTLDDDAKLRIGQYLTEELPTVAPDVDWGDARYMDQLVDGICTAIAAAEAAQPVERRAEPIGYVAPEELPAMKDGVCAFLYPHLDRYATQPVFAQQPASVQPAAVPEGWKDAILSAMDDAFEIAQTKGRLADGALVVDDTQLGVEFAIAKIESMLSAAQKPEGV